MKQEVQQHVVGAVDNLVEDDTGTVEVGRTLAACIGQLLGRFNDQVVPAPPSKMNGYGCNNPCGCWCLLCWWFFWTWWCVVMVSFRNGFPFRDW